ncbi:rhodanese-like domain-containing protein, partial [Arthrospira platensis SPKY1]|nr:rhodanese-like domain-containing protein [Arthrospira platensis SPKY1]
MKQLVAEEEVGIWDARSRGRFEGLEPEPRPGVRSGHIPGSSCLPFSEVLREGQLKAADELRALFGPPLPDQRLVFSCGSGVTACVLALAATVAGL